MDVISVLRCRWWVKSCYKPLWNHLIAGEPGAMVSSTLKLGISILNGGNSDVQQVQKPCQSSAYMFKTNILIFVMKKKMFCPPVRVQRMLDYLKDKKDVGFFLSVQALMQTCRSECSTPSIGTTLE